MSGKIDVKVRLGKSLDKRYNSYPYWYLEVTDESDKNKKVTITPTWKDFQELITNVRLHELRVDQTRERKNDADNWDGSVKEAIKKSQKRISDFEIPEIYLKPKLIK
jgi:hypothetical protein